MSLEEAIRHAKDKSCGDDRCARDHAQLAEWLGQLKQLRGELAGSRKETKALRNELREANGKLSELEAVIDELESELSEMRDKTMSLKAAMADHEQLAKDHAALQKMRRDAEKALKGEGAREFKLKEQLKVAKARLSKEQSLRMKAENNPKIMQERDELRARNARLTAELESLRSARDERDGESNTVRTGASARR